MLITIIFTKSWAYSNLTSPFSRLPKYSNVFLMASASVSNLKSTYETMEGHTNEESSETNGKIAPYKTKVTHRGHTSGDKGKYSVLTLSW